MGQASLCWAESTAKALPGLSHIRKRLLQLGQGMGGTPRRSQI